MPFADRYAAGRRLAAELERFRGEHPVILGLPRGGVVVGLEVARALGAPLDVLVVRKLGVPGAEEVAMGAMAPSATLVDAGLVERLRIPPAVVSQVIAGAAEEMARREQVYRGARAPIDLEGRTVILVDDGLATGATAEAAVESVRRHRPRRIVFAAPVCSPDGAAALRGRADEVVCLECPEDMLAVGLWYDDFTPTSDAEVLQCLRSAEVRRISA